MRAVHKVQTRVRAVIGGEERGVGEELEDAFWLVEDLWEEPGTSGVWLGFVALVEF